MIYLASSARAKTPTAFGAAAEVPPCVVAHWLLPLSVVTCERDQGRYDPEEIT